jgi:hypothetical protein
MNEKNIEKFNLPNYEVVDISGVIMTVKKAKHSNFVVPYNIPVGCNAFSS